jgi:WD40 repeat protein
MIKQSAWFLDSQLILSGSDDGSIFIYSVKTGEIAAVLEHADVAIVNCLVQQPGGRDFASSGIGHDIKVCMCLNKM